MHGAGRYISPTLCQQRYSSLQVPMYPLFLRYESNEFLDPGSKLTQSSLPRCPIRPRGGVHVTHSVIDSAIGSTTTTTLLVVGVCTQRVIQSPALTPRLDGAWFWPPREPLTTPSPATREGSTTREESCLNARYSTLLASGRAAVSSVGKKSSATFQQCWTDKRTTWLTFHVAVVPATTRLHLVLLGTSGA